MKSTFISIGVALLVAVVVYLSIIFFDPGMSIDKAFGLILYSFVGTAALTPLVLWLRRRSR